MTVDEAKVEETKVEQPEDKKPGSKLFSLKRLFRFGLRGLLILVTLCAAALGYWNYKYAPLTRAVDLMNSEDFDVELHKISDLELRPLSALDNLAYKILKVEVDPRKVQSIDAVQIKSLSGFECFENLEMLYVVGESLSDISPLSKLESLEYLCLESNRITDLSPLNGLPALDGLEVLSTSLESLPCLGDCPILDSIDLETENLRSINKLGTLKNLTSLSISGKVNDVSAVGKLSNLTHLSLRDLPITDISELRKLSNIVSFDLTGTGISDIDPVTYMPKLKNLYISRTKVSDLSPLAKVETKSSPIGKDDARPFRDSLSSVHLDDTLVESLEPLKRCSNLKDLLFRMCRIKSLEGIEASKQFKFFDLTGTQVADLSSLEGNNELEHLILRDCQVKDLTSLPQLNLRILKICGPSIKSIEGLSNADGASRLKQVHISDCDVSDLTELGLLKGVEEVTLESIPATELPELKSKNLKQFYLKDVPISDLSSLSKKPLRQLWLNSPGHDFDCESLLSSLALSTFLNELKLENVRLGHLDLLGGFDGLTELSLKGCEMRGYEFLGKLEQLASLEIERSDLKDIDWVSNLKELSIAKFPNCKVSDISAFNALKILREVDLSGCPVRDITPLHSSRSCLMDLNLNKTDITDLNGVADLTGLVHLKFCDTNVTNLDPLVQRTIADLDGQVEHDPYRRSALHPRSIQMAGIILDDPSSLSQLTDLDALDISGSNVTRVDHLPNRLRFLVIENLDIDVARIKERMPYCEIKMVREPNSQEFSGLFFGTFF